MIVFCKNFCIALFAVTLFGCSSRSKTIGKKNIRDPEIIKLQKVLSSLSQRAKDAIPNGNPSEFLSDLHTVLASETGDLLLLCDKTHPLPVGYAPGDLVKLETNTAYTTGRNDLYLRREAERGLTVMGNAAARDGVKLVISSAYRSYDYQVIVYNRLVNLEGKEQADRESARPGTSQHQTGYVVDFGSITDAFADTDAGKWLSEHSEDYGWSLSFPDGYEDVTGYRWESWHYRYIGKTACEFQKKWFGNVQQFMLEFLNVWKTA